eukprot:7730033-Pyramimonas_sp.AAC.1
MTVLLSDSERSLGGPSGLAGELVHAGDALIVASALVRAGQCVKAVEMAGANCGLNLSWGKLGVLSAGSDA